MATTTTTPVINPTITAAGLALFPQPSQPGFSVTLTHIAIGTGLYTPAVDSNGRGTQVALTNEVARYAISSGGNPNPYQLQIGTTITDVDSFGKSPTGKSIGEIGFFAGNVLFAVWSQPTTALFVKSAGLDVPFAYTLDISILPTGSVVVNVTTDPQGMAALILQHMAMTDPHTQYVQKARGMGEYDALTIYNKGAHILNPSDGKTYRSLVDNNVGNLPSSYPLKWERWAFSAAELAAEFVPARTGIQANGTTTLGMVRVTNPDTAYFAADSASQTGAWKIALPTAAYSTMIRFRVEIYDNSTGESITLLIAGYVTTAMAWSNPTATILGQRADRDFAVRFGNDGSKPCVWIGEITSTWGYPRVNIAEVMASYNSDGGTIARWSSGWAITCVTAFGTVGATVTGNLVFGQSDIARVSGLQAALDLKAPLDSAAATGAHSITSTPTATTAQLSLKGAAGVLSTESKLRFYGTFGTGSDFGSRLIASLRAGFNAGTWGTEYLDFYLNSASNDAQSDANQTRLLRMTYGGRILVGNNATDDGASVLQVGGPVAIRTAANSGLLLESTNGLSAGFALSNTTASTGKKYTVFSDATGNLVVRDEATASVRMRVTSAGRILLGTNVDDATNALQVGGATAIAGNITASGTSTILTDYRVGIARNSSGYVPYMVIANGQLSLSAPPSTATQIGNLSFRWASTTSDALAGGQAADVQGYANPDGTGMLALLARDASATVKGRLQINGSGTITAGLGASVDDGVSAFQINPNGATWAALNTPTLRIVDTKNGTGGGLSIDAFQPTIQFIDASTSAKNSRLMQNAGVISFANDPGDNSGVYAAAGVMISPDGYMAVGSGVSLSSNVYYYANGPVVGTGTSQYGFYFNGEFNASATVAGYSYLSTPKVIASAFTLPNLYGFFANVPVFGTGAVVTNYTAFLAKDPGSVPANTFGLRSQIASGTNRWNIYADGSALNFFNARTLFGTTSDDGTNQVQISGSVRAGNYYINSQAAADSGLLGFGNTNGPAIGIYGTGTSNAGALSFKTASVERARFSPAGRFLLGATSDDGSNVLQVSGSSMFNGNVTLGDTTSAEQSSTARTLLTNYRLGIARNSSANSPYLAIANSALSVASPPSTQTALGSIGFRWASTTTDALAGQTAADIWAYANANGSGTLALFGRNSAGTITGRVYVSGSTGNTLVGTGTDDGSTVLQVAAGATGYAISAVRSGASGQWIGIGPGAVSTNNNIDSYSASSNAKQLTINSTTDASNTAPTAGSLGIIFQTLGSTRMTLTQTGHLLVGTTSDDGSSFLQVAGNTLFAGNMALKGSTGTALSLDSSAANVLNQIIFKNAGSNVWAVQSTAANKFQINRYDTSGTLVDASFAIDQTTGVATFNKTPTAPTAAAYDNSTQLSTTAWVLANTMPLRASLGSAVDLNTVIATGIYHQPANAQATAGSNYPVAVAGKLEVYASSTMVYQTYTVYNTGTMYTRAYYNGTWYAWKQIIDSAGGAITGALTIGTTLGVTGAATFSSTLTIQGSATLNSSLAVGAGATITGRLLMYGANSYGEIGLKSTDNTTMFIRGKSSGGGMEWVNNAYNNVVARMDDAGSLYCALAVYAGMGSAWLNTDGNVYGSVWGGWLSNWLTNQLNAKAGASARVQWDSGVVEFGYVDDGQNIGQVLVANPYVMVGLRTTNADDKIYLQGVLLRNQ